MRKTLFVLILLVMVSLLTACGLSEQEKAQVSQIVDEAVAGVPTPETISETRIGEIAAEKAAEAVDGVKFPEQLTEAQVEEIAERKAQEAVAGIKIPEQLTEQIPVEMVYEKSDCPLGDQGVRIDFDGPEDDGFYVLSDTMNELATYAGCNFLIEGRQELVEEHHIWVFENHSWKLVIREGSLWAYPANWNMSNFSTEKPPIAAEFVTAKRQNQVANGYDWVIFVHAGENDYVFPAGQETPLVVLPDNAQFSEPESLVVQGVWDGEMFDASIGAENTITVALLDGKLFYWQDAVDNISYETVQAWIMPSGWSFDQIESWAGEKFPSHDLLEYNG